MQVHGFTESGMIAFTDDNGQNWEVPDDMTNTHRLLIAEWEAEGNAIPAYEAPPVPREPLPRWKFFAVLDIIGITDDVRSTVDGISDQTERAVARAKLEHATSFSTDDAKQFKLSAKDISSIWKKADTIE